MRFRLFPLLCLLLFSSLARAQYSDVVGPTTRPVSLSIIDRETGRPSEVYTHGGQQWIAGEPGHRYALRLRNRSGQRVLAVVSVDGVNVVSGKTASISQEGYVLNPYQSIDITGWRKSYSSVAAFVFSHPYDSYAHQTGRRTNIGVIGVAVFEERPRRPRVIVYEEAPTTRSADMAGAPAAASQQRAQELGTAHGQREASWASSTLFERASPYPIQSLSVRYDSVESLVRRGIMPEWSGRPYSPHPFPESGFVPDP